jgi:uncharacterized protein involved in exopolysaccharide biosynthesis
MPGKWLLVFARLVFSPAAISAVIEPTIGDMRIEWSDPDADASAKVRARLRGYIAFWTIVAISPIAFPRWSASPEIQRSNGMSAASSIRLMLILSVVGLGAGYLYGRAQPVLYRSVAVIRVVQPRVPEAFMKASTPISLSDRLRATEATILSRTRLEHIVKEFKLYPEEQKTEVMEDIVARMRRDIATAPLKGDVFQVQYTGGIPVTVMKVTERLASLFLEESVKDGQRRAEGTSSFLESEVEETARRLAEVNADLERAGRGASAMPKRLELEVLQNRYKELITRREEASATVNLQRRQMGEQFVLLDPAQVPKLPIGSPPYVFTLGGGAVGLGVALLILLGSFLRRFSGGRGDIEGAPA